MQPKGYIPPLHSGKYTVTYPPPKKSRYFLLCVVISNKLKTVKIIGTPKVPGDPDYHNDAKCGELNVEGKASTSIMVDEKGAAHNIP